MEWCHLHCWFQSWPWIVLLELSAVYWVGIFISQSHISQICTTSWSYSETLEPIALTHGFDENANYRIIKTSKSIFQVCESHIFDRIYWLLLMQKVNSMQTTINTSSKQIFNWTQLKLHNSIKSKSIKSIKIFPVHWPIVIKWCVGSKRREISNEP